VSYQNVLNTVVDRVPTMPTVYQLKTPLNKSNLVNINCALIKQRLHLQLVYIETVNCTRKGSTIS